MKNPKETTSPHKDITWICVSKTYMVGDHHFAKTSLPLHARLQGWKSR